MTVLKIVLTTFIYFTFCSVLAVKLTPISDERGWIEKSYLPSLKGSVLYIGVGSYTTQYYTRVQNPELFETIDCLEERTHYGSPFKHHIGDFMLLSEHIQYDNVSFFGILGFSIPYFTPFRTKEQILQSLHKVDSLVKINGTLQISGQIDGTPYLIEAQNSSFWTEIFNAILLQKYETLAYLISPQNLIWWGKKIKN